MRTAKGLVAAVALVCASSIAVAAAAQPSAEQFEKVRDLLTEADANGDGKVTRKEYDAHRADIFEKLDRNGNGVVSEEDAPRVRVAKRKFSSKLEQVLAIADTNGDGMLTRTEWDNPEKDIFALVDQDGDGVIVLDDLPSFD